MPLRHRSFLLTAHPRERFFSFKKGIIHVPLFFDETNASLENDDTIDDDDAADIIIIIVVVVVVVVVIVCLLFRCIAKSALLS
jgi:hypothetical protein